MATVSSDEGFQSRDTVWIKPAGVEGVITGIQEIPGHGGEESQFLYWVRFGDRGPDKPIFRPYAGEELLLIQRPEAPTGPAPMPASLPAAIIGKKAAAPAIEQAIREAFYQGYRYGFDDGRAGRPAKENFDESHVPINDPIHSIER